MNTCLRLVYDTLVTGSSAILIDLRYASDPDLDGEAFSDYLRNADLIIAVTRGRRLSDYRGNAGACYRNDD